jgi:hypothetical protein
MTDNVDTRQKAAVARNLVLQVGQVGDDSRANYLDQDAAYEAAGAVKHPSLLDHLKLHTLRTPQPHLAIARTAH